MLCRFYRNVTQCKRTIFEKGFHSIALINKGPSILFTSVLPIKHKTRIRKQIIGKEHSIKDILECENHVKIIRVTTQKKKNRIKLFSPPFSSQNIQTMSNSVSPIQLAHIQTTTEVIRFPLHEIQKPQI
uniref:Uncharacterized protein MANES_S013500 n=1 Tax=Rhizophora mucronata TaxID=61149 RepID=A0A2P2K249_RHIMU